jgi:hypothetical protein
MSQEFHVVRPALFFSGNIQRAIQRIRIEGFQEKVVIIGGPKMSDQDALEIEKKLTRLAEKFSGISLKGFSDTTELSFQFDFKAWHHVRAFAAYSDYPLKKFKMFGKRPFEKPKEPEYCHAILMSLNSKKTSFPNLIFSHDNKGFFYPCQFETPMETPWGYLGSSIGLLSEINKIKKILKSDGYWHSDIEDFIESFELACIVSIESQLPIVIDG